MANKKYYWLKLKEDFFRQKEIKKLRKVAGGDTYTVIYLKMLLLAIKNDNKIYFDGVEDDFAEELALELDEETDNVKMTLAFLQNQRLIETISEDEYLLPQCKNMTGVESASAERVRRHRSKQKEEQKTLQCNAVVTDGNKNVTTEKEIEKEIDTELELNTTQSSAVVDTNIEFIESKTHLKLTKNMKKIAQSWDKDRLSKSMELFTLKGGKYFSLLEKIYKDDGNFLTDNSIDSKNVNYTNPSNKFANFKPNYLDEFESMEAFDEFIENEFRKQ